jgi:diguanylate cyclase (GGDEF)-like protein/PAS domain S-box-containing protein
MSRDLPAVETRGFARRFGDQTLTPRDRVVIDIIALLAASVLAMAAIVKFNVMEALFTWSLENQGWGLDEFFALFIVATFALGIFARRRWADVQREAHARAAAEASLERSRTRLAKMFDSNPCAIILVSATTGRLLDVNPEFLALCGETREFWTGRESGDVWTTQDFHGSLVQATKGGNNVRNMEATLRTSAGAERVVLLSAEPVEIGDGSALLVTLNDITDRKQLEEQVAHQALHDPLTDLANRVLFIDRIGLALARARRHGGVPAVLFLDLDDFKSINDTLGHDAGDQLLKEVARRIRGIVRASDACARLGGDEFAILLEDGMNAATAGRVAEMVLGTLRPSYTLRGSEVFMGASIGIALAEEQISAGDLMRNADLAMYMAKSSGKQRFALFEPSMHAAAVRRQEMDQELRGALDRREFVLHFQPIVAIDSGQPVGMEALVRWEHPKHGRVPPNEFIPLAEQSGTILDIGRWILNEACTACSLWPENPASEAPMSIAVNISGRQIREPAFVDDVKDALTASGLTPERLILEITESVLVGNDDATVKRLWDVKRLGVKLAIDDFGTGYSSLAYLQEFPVDILKIDKSFTDHLGAGVQESLLSRAVVSLGSTLSIRTVAEGIETQEQWTRLRELGCGYGQGFLFTRPMAAGQVAGYLDEAMNAQQLVSSGD